MTNPIDTSAWKEFAFRDIFEIRKGFYNKKPEQFDKGDIPFLGATDSNNGVTGWYTLDEIKTATKTGAEPNSPLTSKLFPGNAVCVTNDGSVGHAYYQPKQFTCSHSVNPLYRKDGEFSVYTGLFVATVIMHDRYRWQYGRKWRPARMINSKIRLPATASGDPNWRFMEDFIKSLNHKLLTTGNTVPNKLPARDGWIFFRLNRLCDIDMGNKMDFSAMTTDEPSVNFVGRSAENNGVMGKVDAVEGVTPYPAGCITVALGGTLGASFVQDKPFYTSQNVAVLQFSTTAVELLTRLFLATMIQFESRSKYFPFGRELNKYIRTIYGFALPIERNPDGTPVIDPKKTFHDDGYIPDWQFMENYMRSLPYGDRIPEVGD